MSDTIYDSGFYLVRDGQHYVHVATWETYEQAVEQAKKLHKPKDDPYIIIRMEDGSGAIYRRVDDPS